jgi:hypothetical protein
MRKVMRVFWLTTLLVPMAASGQGMLGDVLAGKLIDPENGVYAVYDLIDESTDQRFLLRQAIVGEEMVKGEQGYWVEVEITPELGFPIVYKALLTGPANDPKNIHRIVLQQGNETPVDVPAESLASEEKKAPARLSKGMESLETPSGTLEAEHFVLSDLDDPEVHTEVWINDDVRPMGVVRMVSANGELRLRRFGQGGPDAATAIRGTAVPLDAPEARPKADVKVRVESAPPEATPVEEGGAE